MPESGPAQADLQPLLARLESELQAARREARTAYSEGFRQGKNEWAEETRRWRVSYERVTRLLDEAIKEEPGLVDRLDKALRGWVGRA